MNISDKTDDIIAILVAFAGTIYAGYITYMTGEIPEFFSMGFGLILAFHFTKKSNTAVSQEVVKE